MSDVYLIKGETLTAIADEMRRVAPHRVGDTPIYPTEMTMYVQDVYDEGYDRGYADCQAEGGNSEDLEALGVLCDWQVTTDSNSYPTVTIVNYHPSYYLHCVIVGRGWAQYEESVVVNPNSSSSTLIEEGFSNIQPLFIENTRWKASAT